MYKKQKNYPSAILSNQVSRVAFTISEGSTLNTISAGSKYLFLKQAKITLNDLLNMEQL